MRAIPGVRRQWVDQVDEMDRLLAKKAKFHQLAALWQKETWFLSSIEKVSTHPAYQQIIGMGQDALPFIFQELAQRPAHWFWALSAITGEDPIPETDSGYVEKMAQAWLSWGKQHGYLS